MKSRILAPTMVYMAMGIALSLMIWLWNKSP